MTESPEISAQFLSSTDSIAVSLMLAGGRQYVVLSTQIAVPVAEFPSMLELISARRVTLKATSSL